MKGLTKRFMEDPLGFVVLLAVIVGTTTREAGVISSPWDSVVGSTIALLFALGVVSRPPSNGKAIGDVGKAKGDVSWVPPRGR